jgi:uncharacterized protein (DUF1501 family)
MAMTDASRSEGPRRRDVLYAVGALTLAAGLPRPAAAGRRDLRLVTVVLRGGLDGLSAVLPAGDPAFREARGGLATADTAALPLDGFFSLHPRLLQLHERYRAGEALIVHAAATPYRGRAHDEGAAILESGSATPSATGWLNRAAFALPNAPGLIAVGADTPAILRGPAPTHIFTPAALSCGPAVARAACAAGRGNVCVSAPGFAGDARHRMPQMVAALAQLLADPEGARIAAMRCAGFDTHCNQDATLAESLTALNAVLSALAEGLAPVWSDTVILVTSEFGRTVRANAAGGTDHGLAGAAILLGGAVRGGRVVADWPGLRAQDLHDGGLAATTDLRAIFKGVLRDGFGLSEAALATDVFPESGSVKPLSGLIA